MAYEFGPQDPSYPVPSQRNNFLTLPLEIRLLVYGYLFEDTSTLTDGVEPIDVATFLDYKTARATESRRRRITTHAIALAHSNLHEECFRGFLAGYPLRFRTYDSLKSAWPYIQRNDRRIHLEFGDVSEETMKRALYKLKDLPLLRALTIWMTPKTFGFARLPIAWGGFECLDHKLVRIESRKRQALRNAVAHDEHLFRRSCHAKRRQILRDAKQKVIDAKQEYEETLISKAQRQFEQDPTDLGAILDDMAVRMARLAASQAKTDLENAKLSLSRSAVDSALGHDTRNSRLREASVREKGGLRCQLRDIRGHLWLRQDNEPRGL